MNWISAKVRLPETNQICLVYCQNKNQYIVGRTFGYLGQDGFECDGPSQLNFYFDYNDDTIFWIPIDDIPKPEIK